MEEEAIFIYCLADSVVNACSLSDHSQSLMSHAEVIPFSEITSLMPRSIHARTPKGFLLKVLFFILAVTVRHTLKENMPSAA